MQRDCISSAIVSMHASCVVDRGLEPGRGKTKDYSIGISYFPVKNAVLRSKVG